VPSPTIAPPAASNGQGRKLVSPLPGALATRGPGRGRGRLAAGIAVLGLSALAAMALYGNVGDRQPVLAVARPVAAGQAIGGADLRVVRVAADPGVGTVSASQRSRIVGRTAGVALTPGALLAPAQLAEGPTLPPGSVVVGALLKPGQFPLGLHPGDAVLVMPLASPAQAGLISGQASDAAKPIRATVAGVEKLPDSGGATSVSLAVVPELAPTVAAAGAEGRLSVMRELL